MTKLASIERSNTLLGIIQRNKGKTLTRGDIAAAMNKTRLTIREVRLLDDLVGQGLIEGEKKPIKSPIGYEWQYRAK